MSDDAKGFGCSVLGVIAGSLVNVAWWFWLYPTILRALGWLP